MHYFQIEILAHERQGELVYEARERRLAQALKSADRNEGLLHQLLVRHFAGVLRASHAPGSGGATSRLCGEVDVCESSAACAAPPMGGKLRSVGRIAPGTQRYPRSGPWSTSKWV